MYLPLLLVLAQGIVSDNAPHKVQPFLTPSGNNDGAPARDAILYKPSGLAEDSGGNVYISEEKSNRIRRVLPDGTIETYAQLQAPTALLVTPDQDLLYFDNKECVIRKIRQDKSVEAIAGAGTCAAISTGGFGASSGKDGPALTTSLGNLGAMIYDNDGRLVFTETSLHIIRRLNSDGTLETLSGQRTPGDAGDNEKAVDATLSSPTGLTIDADGYLYIADTGNCRVRRIDPTNYIETYIGTSSCASSSSTLTGSRSISIEQPGALWFDRAARALYITQPRAYRVLRYNLEVNRVQPVFGSGKLGTTIVPEPLDCPINETGSMILSSTRGLLVAAPSSFQVLSFNNATADRFAGQWPQNVAAGTQILDPRGIAITTDGATLVLDAGTNRLLRIEADQTITTLAGTTWPAGFSKGDNGLALEATLDQPLRLAIRPNGDIIIAEPTRLRLLTVDGILKTIRTGVSSPSGLAFDSQGRLVYSEAGNHRIMRLDIDTNIATRIAGTGVEGFSGDGGAATSAKLASPGEVAFDSQGTLLIADRGNRRVRRLSTDSKIKTIAGNGLPFSYADITGELATRTGLGLITGLAIDTTGNVYISEEQRITRIAADGRLQIVTGYQFQADDGTIYWLNEPLNDADAVLYRPDATILYTVRGTPAIRQLLP